MSTIGELLASYRDRTGASYDDMSEMVGDAITGARFHQLTTKPPQAFPQPQTLQHLADLLHVSVATVVLAFAAALGLPVQQNAPILAISLPPGTDNLTDRDREAILAVTRALVDARRQAAPKPAPDLSKVQGLRLEETNPNLHVVEKTNGPD